MEQLQSKKRTASTMSRRSFISTGVGMGMVSIIPNHVFAAKKQGLVAPSDKICLLHIGCGTQSLVESNALLKSPDIEIVGLADPNRESYDYIYWQQLHHSFV